MEFLRRRQFFEAPVQLILCLWWVPEGRIPTVDEAIARLAHLRAHGPTPTAFTFRHRFEPDDDPPRWRSGQLLRLGRPTQLWPARTGRRCAMTGRRARTRSTGATAATAGGATTVTGAAGAMGSLA